VGRSSINDWTGRRMTIPITGALVLIAGIFLFFFSRKLLYAAMIISIPFSAMAVLNLGSGDQAKGVSAWVFLAALWFLREALAVPPPWHKPGWFSSNRARWGLLAFLAAVIASLCVPLLLGGTAWLPDPNPLGNKTFAVRFSFYNITQTAYLAFGIALAVLAAAQNCASSRLSYTLKLYVGSCIFVAGWGLFQFWCILTGHVYPAFIFNTSATPSALGYAQTLGPSALSLSRVSSAALEPSVLAEELLIALVVLLVCRGLRKPLLSRKLDYAAMGLITAALLVTTSSTAYAGLVIAPMVAAAALSLAGKSAKPYLLLAGGVAAAAALAVILFPPLRQLTTALITGKFQTESGIWRMHSLEFAARDFIRYPILGAGWHTVDCWDLVLLLLANTGLVGLLAFCSFLVPVWRGLWRSARKQRSTAVALLAAMALTLVLSELAGLTYSAGYVWLVFGLAAGAVASTEGRLRRSAGWPRHGDGRSSPEGIVSDRDFSGRVVCRSVTPRVGIGLQGCGLP
jgi:hypothetical protein